jgi:AraC family transcriptional regulator
MATAAPMPETITSTDLFASDQLYVSECVCRSRRGGCAGEEEAAHHTFVFVRSGLFVHHSRRRALIMNGARERELVGDPTRVLLFSKGVPYRVSHPVEGGDTCVTFTPSPKLLREALAEFDPAAAERPDAPLPLEAVAADPEIFLLQSRIAEQLKAAPAASRSSPGSPGPPEPLGVEEAAIALIRSTLARGFTQQLARRDRRAGRAATRTAHRDLVEAARALLAARFRRRLALGEVARAVHASPWHLCRLFRSETGMTMQRFLHRLRVREALARLAGGAGDLTEVALSCGFYDHSHFTHAFRREFGVPPSHWRATLASRAAGIGNRLQV